MKTIYLVGFLLAFTSGLFAQQSLIYSHSDLLKSDNIRKELETAKKKLTAKPDDAKTLLTIGFCYLLMPEKKDSSYFFIQSARSAYRTKANAEEAFLRTGVLLGQAYRLNNQFTDAKTQLLSVQKQASKNPIMVKFIEQELMITANAKNMKQNPDYVFVKNLANINSKYSDHSPMLYHDSVLIFTSKQKTKIGDKKRFSGNYSEDIFFTYYEPSKNEWHKTKVISRKVKSKNNTSNCGISNDKKTIYVYQNSDIYEMKREGDKWKKPKKTRLPVNSKADDKNICFTPDGKYAYLSSNRPGGHGEFDIYRLTRMGATSWSQPENIGTTINTAQSESSPFIDAEGTLFFSSKGHNGNGGYDIFRAYPDGKGGFKTPENMGWPINSEYDDIFFYRSKDLKHAVFTSRRPEGSKGKSDIYMATFFDYLVAYGSAIKKGLDGDGVYVQSFKLSDKGTFELPQVSTAGSYTMLVNHSRKYFAKAEAKGYFFETIVFETPSEHEKRMEIDQMVLDKIDYDKVFKQYTPNCKNSTITNEFALFLNTLISFLEIHPEFSCDLSLANNGIAENYLKKNGIPESQLSFNLYKSGNCAVTIYQKGLDTEEFSEYKPTPEPIIKTAKKIKYTIQVGAFNQNLDINHWFFRSLRGKVIRRDDKDHLNRYIIGVYEDEDEAKRKLPNIINLGFFDAFIREVDWYDQK